MDNVLQDIRYALRQLRKNSGFTAVAVITLALGFGANTSIFSVINSALIEPLPYPNPKQLVYVQETLPDGHPNGQVSGGAFKDWRMYSSKFSHLAVFENTRRNLTGIAAPERLTGLEVSAEFLPLLGITPILGRDFSVGEDTVGENNRVILLSHALWQMRFGGDRSVLGKVVLLDQIPYTVIGVLPPNALLQDDAKFLVPDVIDAPGTYWGRAGHWRAVIGRLQPGVTVSEAQAELRGIKQRLTPEYPSFKKDWSVAVVPLQEVFVGESRPGFVILLGAVTLVLLIACANISNLLVARGNARSREMAIRSALGAGSSRIVRQVLTESILLALCGCALGLLFANLGIHFLSLWLTGKLPQVLHPQLNLSVLVFTILVASSCGILFGILPAWRMANADVNHALKEAERSSASRSKKAAQSFVVISEFALTLLLLIGAGLFLRSFKRLLDTDPGFNSKYTLAFDLTLPQAKYPNLESQSRFTESLRARISALAGVEFVGSVSNLPFSEYGDTEFVSRADQPPRTDYLANCSFIGGDYFPALGIRVLRGRALTKADNTNEPARVVVIDSAVERDLYNGEDPIGRFLRFQDKSWEIVGVVGSVHHFGLDSASQPNIYMAQSQYSGPISLILRTALPPLALAETVRKTTLEADPDLPIGNVRTLEQDVNKSVAPRRTTLVLVGIFAIVAICLASIGIYGVVSYAIGQRAREFSIRSALGAQRRDIVRLVLSSGMRLSIAGIVAGLLGAFAFAHLLESQLYEVKAHDPVVFIGSVCLLGFVAALSIYIPARRAAKVDPIVALRYE